MCKTKLVFTNSWRSKKEKHKRMFFIIPAIFSSTDCWKRQCIGILILLTKLDFTHFCVAFDHITTDLFSAVCRLKFSKQSQLNNFFENTDLQWTYYTEISCKRCYSWFCPIWNSAKTSGSFMLFSTGYSFHLHIYWISSW